MSNGVGLVICLGLMVAVVGIGNLVILINWKKERA